MNYERFCSGIIAIIMACHAHGTVLNVQIAAEEARNEGLQLPNMSSDGRYHTMNDKGGILMTISPAAQAFIQIAIQPGSKVLEIGTGYGKVCIEALKRGASHYVANDIGEKHLKILARKIVEEIPEKQHSVVLLPRPFPEQEVINELEENTYDAILTEFVLHFFNEPQVRESFKQFKRLLKPGGKLFIAVSTAYIGFFKKSMLQQFEQDVSEFFEKVNSSSNGADDANLTLPGFHPNTRDLVDRSKMSIQDMDSIALTKGHYFAFIESTVKFLLTKEKFEVISSEYQPTHRKLWLLDGRESLVVVAQKPIL